MLDLRLPVGLFFLIVGATLGIDGLFHPIRTPGVSFILNRDWGVCLLIFGAFMAGFGWRAQRCEEIDLPETTETESGKHRAPR